MNIDTENKKYAIDFKNKKLENYVRLTLNKSKDEPITTEDLKQIKSLKLNKSILNDSIPGDLNFFTNLESLSLSDITLSQAGLKTLNNLGNLRTLSISNSTIDFSQTEQLPSGIQNLIFVNCNGVNFESLKSNSTLKNLTIIGCKNADFKNISKFKKLEELNLPDNKDLTENDLTDVWGLETLERVNLDGNGQITEQEHGDIEISQRKSYLPAERFDWNSNESSLKNVQLSSLANMSPEDLENLSGLNISITKADMEFLQSDYGKRLISSLQSKNAISIYVNTTADLSMEQLDSISQICEVSKVHVGTGWEETQKRGYSMETYKAIKQEIVNITKDIDPNLPDAEKYKIIHDKLAQNIQYDYSALQEKPGSRDYYTSRNLENGLLYGTCVCAGYADILKNVLSEVGIESTYVEGRTDQGELHAWNQVKIVDKSGKANWYNVDLTWDSTQKGTNYYLQDDATFSKTHTPILSRTEKGAVHGCPSALPYRTPVYKTVDFER